MKKKNVFIAFVLTLLAMAVFAQDSATVISNDSATTQEIIQLSNQIIDDAVQIADKTNNEIVPGMDNKLTGGIIAVIVTGIIASIRKRKKKKSQQ